MKKPSSYYVDKGVPMKHTSISQLCKRAAALALAAVIALPTVYATAGEQRLTTTRTVVEGLDYVDTITEHASAGRVESYAFHLSPDSQAFPIMIQSAGTIYGAATINKAISLAEGMGYQVLGGVNSDFFTLGNGIPNGISIEDGVYKSSPGTEAAVTATDGRVDLVVVPQVNITLVNQRDDTATVLTHFNKWRDSSGGLYLYNEDFSTVSTRTDNAAGWMVRMRLVVEDGEDDEDADVRSGVLTVNSTLTLEVTEVLQTDQSLPIGEGNYILTAANESNLFSVYESFQVGDRVTLTTSCQDEVLSQAQWAGGCGDIMVWDGQMTDNTLWTYNKDGRNPRTAMGVKEDGTAVFYVVDGRKSGYSGGLSQVDLARELLEQGCVWAVNLDGGGSSTFSVRTPGTAQTSIVNSPSEGRARSCATFILLVTDQPGDGKPDRLALKEDGLVVLAGSSLTLPGAVALDSTSNPLDNAVEDLTYRSQEGLGTIEDGVYTAGSTPGTDTILLRSRGLGIQGTAQIHVVDSLTSLTVTRAGQTTALSSLSMKAGDSVALSATGSYWSRAAMRDIQPVTWSVAGDIGSITEDGVFTASGSAVSGSITAEAGGQSKTISVSLSSVHTDVTEDHWSYTAVEFCYEKGIVGGISPTLFGRDEPIRRGDFLLMLYAAAGRPAVSQQASFTDVLDSDYFCTAVSWAQENGLASGVSEGIFSPHTSVTREQAFTMLRRAMPILGIQCEDGPLTALDQFSDKDAIADYAKPHMATLVTQGIASGGGGIINPTGNLTRAEMAALLYRLLNYTPPAVDPQLPPDPDPEQPSTTEPQQPPMTEPEQPVTPGSQDIISSDAVLGLDQTELTLDSAQTQQLRAILIGAEGSVTWTSSDPAAAVVSADGAVTNIFAGTGTREVAITASYGPLTASCTVLCQPASRTGVVTGASSGLNVRSGPSQANPVIAGLRDGAQVIILGEEDGWFQILTANSSGQAVLGYASAAYLIPLE